MERVAQPCDGGRQRGCGGCKEHQQRGRRSKEKRGRRHREERAAAGWVRGRGCGAARHSKDEEGAVAGLMPGGVVGVKGIFGIYT
jgi:hypothetical protein